MLVVEDPRSCRKGRIRYVLHGHHEDMRASWGGEGVLYFGCYVHSVTVYSRRELKL